MTQQWTPSQFKNFNNQEHDACGIVSSLEKEKIPTRENIFSCIDALVTMNHRAGFINGEGDGVGIHIDIPRTLWKEKLKKAQIDPTVVDTPNFVVGHLFFTRNEQSETFKTEVRQLLDDNGFSLIFESDEVTDSSALGPIAIQENPVFWQIACTVDKNEADLNQTILEVIVEAEKMNLFT